MSDQNRLVATILTLASELAVAIEMSYDPVEMRELWSEALDGLKDARQILLDNGLPVPGEIDNVILLSQTGL